MPPPPGPAAALGTALLLLLLASESSHTVLLRAREAAQFLRPRQRRAYQVFEEAKQGHLERECVEEVCSKEEAREVFENDPETEYFYPRYQECMRKYGRPEEKNPDFAKCVQNLPDQCTPNPCDKKGTHICQDLMGNFFCVCTDGWGGRLCDKDTSARLCAHLCWRPARSIGDFCTRHCVLPRMHDSGGKRENPGPGYGLVQAQ